MERPEDAAVAGAEVGDNPMIENVVSHTDKIGDVKIILPRDAATEDNTVIPTEIARAEANVAKPPVKNTKSTQHFQTYWMGIKMDTSGLNRMRGE